MPDIVVLRGAIPPELGVFDAERQQTVRTIDECGRQLRRRGAREVRFDKDHGGQIKRRAKALMIEWPHRCSVEKRDIETRHRLFDRV